MEQLQGNQDQRAQVVGKSGDALKKDWKFYLSLTLFGWSALAIAVAALVPMLPLSTAAAAAMVTGIIVSAEIAFWAGAALLGRPFIQACKARILAWFKPERLESPRPISKGRHYTGVILLLGSGLFYYAAAACAFLDLPRGQMLTAIVAILLAGEAVFIASLFILGSDFWARLKQLFQWPGAMQAS